jgi:hypothetical protein
VISANAIDTKGRVWTVPPASVVRWAPNDNFADATTIESWNSDGYGSTTMSTTEPGEPDTGADSIWWRWTATNAGTISVSVNCSFPYSNFAVFSGDSVTNLQMLGSQIVNVEAGKTYHIVVSSLYWVFTGDVHVHLVFTPAPSNDLFNNREELSGTNINISRSNLGASLEPNEPVPGLMGGRSLWWTWRAPAQGYAQIDIQGIHPLMAVYQGTSLSNLVLIKWNLIASGIEPLLAGTIGFVTEAGKDYQIATDTWNGSPGTLALHLSFSPDVPNDFINSIPLVGTNISVGPSAERLVSRYSVE